MCLQCKCSVASVDHIFPFLKMEASVVLQADHQCQRRASMSWGSKQPRPGLLKIAQLILLYSGLDT